jgi:hypothetical protein
LEIHIHFSKKHHQWKLLELDSKRAYWTKKETGRQGGQPQVELEDRRKIEGEREKREGKRKPKINMGLNFKKLNLLQHSE